MNLKLLRSICFLLLAGIAANSQAQPTQFDTSFDGDGELSTPFPGTTFPDNGRTLRIMAALSDNSLMVAGTDRVDSLSGVFARGRIGKLNATTGQSVSSYGGNGDGLAELGDLQIDIEDFVVMPDGSAFLCGNEDNASGRHGLIARVTADGQLDVNWHGGQNGGVLEMRTGVVNACYGLERLGDGRLVAVGRATNNGSTDNGGALVSFITEDGEFQDNEDLWLTSINGYTPTRAYSVAEQPGLGVVVLVGASWVDIKSGPDLLVHEMRLIRTTYDGELDTGFGTRQISGTGKDSAGNGSTNFADHFDIDPVGRIRLSTNLALADLLPDWRFGVQAWSRNIDGTSGIGTEHSATAGADFSLRVGASALGPDGKVVIASLQTDENSVSCTAGISRNHQHLLRLTPGALNADSTFDGDGQFDWLTAAQTFPSCSTNYISALQDVVLQRNGRMTVLSTMRLGYPVVSDSKIVDYPLITQLQGNPFSPMNWDIDPDALTFTPASARPNALTESDFVEITGLDAGVQVPAYVLGGEMRVGFGSWSTARWVKNGDWVQLRGVAPAGIGSSATASLFVGGIRGHNSWDSLGDRQRADFVITANAPALPGARCSAGGLNSNCSAAIPDEGSVSSSINFVNGGSCNFVQGVRVGVDIEHSYIGDLRIKLTDPNGQVFIGGSEGIVTLLNRPKASAGSAEGSCSGDDIIASFDDAASIDAQTACGVPVSNPALSGDVAPAYRLSELVGRRTTGNDGANANGLWTLTIDDLVAGNSGQLHDWSLDIDCSASAPAISDLSVTVDGHTTHPWLSGTNNVVPGAGVNITWTVTNNGPMATSNGRFRASLPDGLTDAIENTAWGCSTSAGGSCTPAIPCFGACLGNDIDAGLSLPVGGTATFFATGTLTELAGDGTLVIHGKTSVPQAIGGTRDDNPDNDNVQLQMPIQRITDIAVTGARHSWQGNVATIEVDISNLGPSNSLGFSAYINLPIGMNITGFSCRRGNLPCDDSYVLPPPYLNVLQITQGNGMLPNRTPYTAVITATWPGSDAPGLLQAYPSPDITAIDFDMAAFEYAIGAPGTSSGDIFSNGFE